MKNRKILALSVLAPTFVLGPVMACDICSVYSAQQAQGGGKGFYGGIAEQFTQFGTLQNDGVKEPANGEFIHSSVSQLFAGYNFNQHFGVQLNLPMIYRAYGSSTGVHGSDAGIGDVSLTGNVRLYQKSTDNFSINWTALGGIKLPTGNSSWLGRPDFDTGIGGHDLALGSGSVDGIIGTGFSVRWKKIFFDGETQYAIRTEGDFQHQYANDLTWSCGPGVYLALKDDYTLAVQVAATGETKGKDTFTGVPDDDSAERIVYVGPKISFTWSENLSGHVGADLPVSINNTGEQLVPDFRVHAAVTWRF